ncbi:hypothetical protein CL619_03235 [archaeon]|nr:hypothetical protein [archaeon]|tara:strand:- start:2207 stop:3010 length:804 start_codon:yes stop_codon:yes gene_type:complete
MDLSKAQELAAITAKTILEKAYIGEDGQYDVMLFGSTIREEAEPKDLDLLVIHNHPPLDIYAFFTEYDPSEGDWVAMDRARIGVLENSVELFLKQLGSHEFRSNKIARNFFARLGLFKQKISTVEGSHWINEDRRRKKLEDLPVNTGYFEFGDLMIRIDPEKDRDAQINEFRAKYSNKFVWDSVKAEFAKHDGLDYSVLHLMAMNQGVLEPTNKLCAWTRGMMLKQAPDAQFWPDILTEGRLYNSESGEFDIAVVDKYEKAIDLMSR